MVQIPANEPVAIVGSACRFAGNASSPSKLWELLKNPKDVRSNIPDSRFSLDNYYHPNNAYHGRSNVQHTYLLEEDVAAFDTEFFGIKPIEARAVDPQQRILMETVYESLESAGFTVDSMRNSDTGVFVGLMCGDYEAMLLRDLQKAPVYTATGIGRSIVSNRVSYFFDWHGPSMTLDTACSSSLVALHLAVQALRSGECGVAIAAGTNLCLGPENYIIESKLKMLSPDGRCRMWDQDANGYARGEGVAATVLKPLSAAIADGDDIECIIRETGINQDGATTGLTMPSSTAQEALIRSTYAKAGLDIASKAHRPQYFEAHGTGTPAGDPIEAEAISSAFFGSDLAKRQDAGGDPLYVGSIKTVLGHTEGTAGVAAVLKASLALQNSTLPPNMLLNKLSDQVAPFTARLEIPTSAQPWPETAEGQPKRASVNSFGFGGANAHAILEAYTPTAASTRLAAVSSPFAPFVFSAASRPALRATLSEYASHLERHPDTNLRDLAFTLHRRRSAFPYRIAFTAQSTEQLQHKIENELATTKPEALGDRVSAALSSGNGPQILAVFTGQGAQYARMGAELLETSPEARRIVAQLQAHLEQLPEKDRPSYSLEDELRASVETSRVLTGPFSFMSTVVQIVLVDLLRLAGVEFSGIVAHSSGEMAAAYAAGWLSARDAVVIAYYRGGFAHKMVSPNGPDVQGGMLAAGMSPEDAQALCEDRDFAGRVCVAAVNSSSSVTLSGDLDAIDELQIILDDENKFNRRLRVDRAYHSNHVLKHLHEYVDALRSAGVTATPPPPRSPFYVSSVYGREVDAQMDLSSQYWGDSVAKSVFFYQAVQIALNAKSYDLAIEIGPHPALKGPATQTIQETLGKAMPYLGVLSRGVSAVDAVGTCLGSLWAHAGNAKSPDLYAYEVAMSHDVSASRTLKGLPTYQWNHSGSYWHDTRAVQAVRHRGHQFNELLGNVSADSAPHRLSWNHLLRVSELEWISGHQVQTQTVFPAAGYICTALEAARVLAGEKTVKLIEIKDFTIHQALTFDANDSGIEVLTSLSNIRHTSDSHIQATFTYSAGLDSQDLALVAEAEVRIALGASAPTILPLRAPTPPHMISVDRERFYNLLQTLGYGFDGSFKSLHTLRRRLGLSDCSIYSVPRGDFGQSVLVHPAELDGAIQSLILSYSYPDDDQLLNMHLPTSVSSIRFNPTLCESMTDITASGRLGPQADSGFSGDVSMYTKNSACAAIQLQNIELQPLGALSEQQDRKVFSKYEWVRNGLDGNRAARDSTVTKDHENILEALERISTYYLHQFDQEVPSDSPLRSEGPHRHYLRYAHHILDLIRTGEHKVAKTEWLQDSLQDVLDKTEFVSDLIDHRMMHLVGQTMPRVFKGETTMLEEFRVHEILDDYYQGAFGSQQAGRWIGRIMGQFAERYPHLNILEVGAGTGGATTRILDGLDSHFLNYTFTDLSSGFFDRASETFSAYKDRMIFKTFDCGQDPVNQGYTAGAYDVIVAFLVIHATPDLELTMRNIRKLLKPGGYLVVGEGTNNGQPYGSAGFIFGTLPGWWLGADSDRPLSPFVPYSEWERLLVATGFSGIDCTAPQAFQDTLGMTVFVSQAVDDTINLLREPRQLDSPKASHAQTESLIIVGGSTQRSSRLVQSIKQQLQPHARQSYHFEKLTDVDFDLVDANTLVVSLSELDKPIFADMTPTEFSSLKLLFSKDSKLFWVTSGRLDREPFQNMVIGFSRTAVYETAGLRFQNIDIAEPDNLEAEDLVVKILRFNTSAALINDAGSGQMPWPFEPEIFLDDKGLENVPRLRHIAERNDRYNSARRQIVHDVDPSEVAVSLQQNDKGWKMQELSRWSTPPASDDRIRLHVSTATMCALHTPHGHKFLVLGRDMNTQARYLALVPVLQSIIYVSKEAAVVCPEGVVAEASMLNAYASRILAMTVVDGMVAGESMVVHNATQALAHAIADRASVRHIHTVFAADDSLENIPDSWVRLQPYATHLEIAGLIPPHVSSFVGLSKASPNENAIKAGLPPHCRRETLSTLYSRQGWDSPPQLDTSLCRLLRQVIDDVHNISGTCTTIHASELLGGLTPQDPSTILDWTESKSCPARVSRLDSCSFFKSDKTYWMCGLSGSLGVSLGDWMIERGARHVVLTSRNPNISPDWIEAHRKNGVYVVIVPCDVTNESALRQAYQKICDSQPPIAGVLNGAMVLRDVSIQNMSFEQMNDTIRPKVYGSIHLDRIFANEDLDFFILFSSINCVIGNLGQSNYAAANTFMCSLAAQRRKRGLAATALNVGAIIGAGYMERESSKALDLTVSKMALMHLSEQDYHQLFAEGIDAGRPDSCDEAELTTGLLDIPAADAENAPKWHTNPVFADFVVHQVESRGADAVAGAAVSVMDQLATCQTADEAIEVVKGRLAMQIRHVLQMDTPDVDLMAMRSRDIGLDSLISVDIRSWILKNFEVSVPVLKIMGNDTMAELADLVAAGIPPRLLPAIAGNDVPTLSTQALPNGTTSREDSDAASKEESSSSSRTGTASPAGSSATSLSQDDITSISSNKLLGDNGVINWDLETALPTPATVSTNTRPATRPRVIILTGASGLLGKHLLQSLLQDTEVDEVICIATRRLRERQASKELVEDPRVRYFEGSLDEPRLGLSEEDAVRIFSRADAVIHNGADVSHMKFYQSIKAANAESTKELIRYTMTRRVPIHYLSTVGVALFGDYDNFSEVSVTHLRPPTDGSQGYVAAKWVSEVTLDNLHKEGSNVWIHRPSTIIREGAYNENSAAQLDWMNSLVTYMLKTKTVPRFANLRGALDFIHPESAVRNILSHVFKNTPKLTGEVSYVHEVGDIVIPLHNLKEYVTKVTGEAEIGELSPQQWALQATEAGLHRGVAALIEAMDDPGQPNYPRMLKEAF